MSKNRIVITVEGGMVQDVNADNPDGVEVTIVDFDTEGSDEEDLTTLPNPRYPDDPDVAIVRGEAVAPMTPACTRWLDAQDYKEGQP